MKIEPGMRVVITGAASGIGRATALAFARLGCRLFLTDINPAGLEETKRLAESAGGKVDACSAFDVADRASVAAFAEGMLASAGPPDILANVAGVALFCRIEDMTHAHWEKVIGINLWGPIHTIEYFLPAMIRAGRGHLVNVSSACGLMGFPWHAAYAVTKWGLLGLSEVIAADAHDNGIGVSVVCPGGVNTPLKQTVEIPRMDKNSAQYAAFIRRFEKVAVSPERVAEQIVGAVRKNKFLVVTSRDITLLYWLKILCPPTHRLAMLTVARMMNKMRTKEPKPA